MKGHTVFFPPNPYPDLMVDIETLSTRPNAAIISIAAVPFNKDTGQYSAEQFYEEIGGDLYPTTFHINPKTIAWWDKQPVPRPTGTEHPEGSLNRFRNYLLKHHPIYIWANSPSFDLIILKEAFSNYQIEWPHEFWNERDVRTLRALSNIPKFKPTHNAIQDCLLQIHVVCATLQQLKK